MENRKTPLPDKNAIDRLRDIIIDVTCETVKCPKSLLTETPEDIDLQKQKAYARAIGKLLYPQNDDGSPHPYGPIFEMDD